ncbi:MAG: hypothetical protein HYT87_20135 [Nitrospirae bacterium]|nr:hypothetical protein [Nitrospirota bacterium]
MEREDQRLIDGYQAGILALEDLKQRRESIAAHQTLMEARLKEIEEKQKERQRSLHLVEGVEVFCKNIHGALERPNFESKVKILRLVLDRVIVQDGQLVIRHTIPLGEFRSGSDLGAIPKNVNVNGVATLGVCQD